MAEVFQPANRRMYEIILKNADLLTDDTMPEFILRFCASVTAQNLLLQRWGQGDHRQLFVDIEYPSELTVYAQQRYASLKARQAELLRLTS
jgi:hypothetical protein